MLELFDLATHPTTLREAWERVERNDGAPGGDGISCATFGRSASQELRSLADSLRSWTYTPGPCRQVRIPKRSGGKRTLTIPTIPDRVVHTAIASVLVPYLEEAFEESSFAYRQGRGVRNAVARIEAWRGRGFVHVVEADINDYFNSVCHSKLLSKLKILLEDLPGSVDLIRLVEVILEYQARTLGLTERGLIQGSPLSPHLANLFLDALDETMEGDGVRIVRYADDFVILCKSERRAERALNKVRKVLSDHGLKLNTEKSGVVTFERGFEFLGYLFQRSLVLKQDRRQPKAVTPTVREHADTPKIQEAQRAEPAKSPAPRDKTTSDTGFRVAHLITPDRWLDADNHVFTVSREGQTLQQLHASRVHRIEVPWGAKVCWNAVEECIRSGTTLAVVNRYGATVANLAPNSRLHSGTQFAQAQAVDNTEFRLIVAKQLVAARIRNQRAQLARTARGKRNTDIPSTLAKIKQVLSKLDCASTIEAARGYEGSSGALYWPGLSALCREAGTKPFKRSRPAADPLNAVINYFCGILERDVRAAIMRAGLHTGFGFLHQARDRSDALVYDLMEPFRAPLTEGLAVYLFNARRLRSDMFEVRDTEVTILREGRRALIKGYETQVARRIFVSKGKPKLDWRAVMLRQAFDLVNAVKRHDPEQFRPYLMRV
jgi:CRISPR-associated protein Cas1